MSPRRYFPRSGIAFAFTTGLILSAVHLRAEDEPATVADAPQQAQADATKAAQDEIQRAAAEKKAERAEQAKLQRRAARQVPARRSGGLGAMSLEQRRARQRQLDAAFRRRPGATVGQMLAGPRLPGGPMRPGPMMPPGFGPGQPQVRNFQWPNGGGFIMRWGF